MEKEWINGSEGYNLKYKRETLLNYAMNRWGLNKAQSVDATSELIRNCAPADYATWVDYYFNNATQKKKKNGLKITREYLHALGEELYLRLSENVHNELGIAIISTPKGIMTDKDARKNNVGGEVLAYVW